MPVSDPETVVLGPETIVSNYNDCFWLRNSPFGLRTAFSGSEMAVLGFEAAVLKQTFLVTPCPPNSLFIGKNERGRSVTEVGREGRRGGRGFLSIFQSYLSCDSKMILFLSSQFLNVKIMKRIYVRQLRTSKSRNKQGSRVRVPQIKTNGDVL